MCLLCLVRTTADHQKHLRAIERVTEHDAHAARMLHTIVKVGAVQCILESLQAANVSACFGLTSKHNTHCHLYDLYVIRFTCSQ